MQIRNDYSSFQGTGYQHSHTHHFTKCLHPDEHRQPESSAAGAGAMSKTDSPQIQPKSKQDILSEYHDNVTGTERKTSGLKRGFGILKNIWDSMGDGKKEGTQSIAAPEGEQSFEGSIDAAASAIKHGFPHQIINRWENVREKIKTGIRMSLKRFGKNSNAFGALTDPQGRFMGKKGTREQYSEKAGGGTRKEKPDILSAALPETHLMDSYSKTGEYCHLNENLTYQKGRNHYSTSPQPSKDE